MSKCRHLTKNAGNRTKADMEHNTRGTKRKNTSKNWQDHIFPGVSLDFVQAPGVTKLFALWRASGSPIDKPLCQRHASSNTFRVKWTHNQTCRIPIKKCRSMLSQVQHRLPTLHEAIYVLNAVCIQTHCELRFWTCPNLLTFEFDFKLCGYVKCYSGHFVDVLVSYSFLPHLRQWCSCC